MVHKDVKADLINELKKNFEKLFESKAEENPQFPKIINKKHFDRLNGLIETGQVIYGGKANEKTNQISLTLLDNVDWDDPIMQEEIFGPILPIIVYEELDELPHYDTINNFLKGLEPIEVEKIRDYMIRELFKKRCLEKYRLLDKYWTIAVDATGLATFREKHCDQCLKREYKNQDTGEVEKTIYFHFLEVFESISKKKKDFRILCRI